jgi:hypothetical protein
MPPQLRRSGSSRHLNTVLPLSSLWPYYLHTTILPQDALHCFDRHFLCSLRSIFQWVRLTNYMQTTFLTLFVAMAYAKPVALQGATLKRRCDMSECREGVWTGVSKRE